MTSVSNDSESVTPRRRFSLVGPGLFFVLGMLAAGGMVLLPQDRAVMIKSQSQHVLKPGQHVMAIVGSFLHRIFHQVQDFFDVGALPDDDLPLAAVYDVSGPGQKNGPVPFTSSEVRP